MNFLVIDAEFFNDGIVKELAVVSPFFSLAFSFAPNQEFSTLQLPKQKLNNWLTRNLHGITWESGYLPYQSLPKIAAIFNNPAILVYVKGHQKINNLRKFLPDVKYLNLESIGCPTIAELLKESRLPYVRCCNYPQTHNSVTYERHCAQRKAMLYYQWLMMQFCKQ